MHNFYRRNRDANSGVKIAPAALLPELWDNCVTPFWSKGLGRPPRSDHI